MFEFDLSVMSPAVGLEKTGEKRSDASEKDREEREDKKLKEREDDEEQEREAGSALPELRLVLIGRTGSGKSASGNTILGRCHFLSELRAGSVTQVCELGSADLPEDEEEEDSCRRKTVVVVDMPGFGDTRLSPGDVDAEIARCVVLSAPGPHAFLLVIPLGRYTQDEQRVTCHMQRVFGEEALQRHTLVLFTRGDDLEAGGGGVERFLGGAPEELGALLQTCRGRYHVLNNREPGNRGQVRTLLRKVEEMVEQNGGQCYISTMYQEAELAIREEQERLMSERGEGSRDGGMTSVKRRRTSEQDERMRGERWGDERTSEGWGPLQERGKRWWERERERKRRRNSEREEEREKRRSSAVMRHSFPSALSRFRREAALSRKVLERVKVLVAAGATGLAVGAVLGTAAPLAVAAGASVMGGSVGLVAGQLAGVSVAGVGGVGKALGAIVATATGEMALAVGAATGGVLGGSVGALAGAEAATPGAAALEALEQVGAMGVTVVGVAAGVGGALGAGAVVRAVLEGGAVCTVLTEAKATAGAASIANTTAVAAPQAVATGGRVAAAVQTAGDAVLDTAAACSSQSVVTARSGLTGTLNTVGTTARVLTAVLEIGKAAAGIVLAGGLVVKVVKEKVRSATGSSAENSYCERNSYEIHWNK